MKYLFCKFLCAISVPALVAGIFGCAGWGGKLARGVVIEGLDVGGMSRPQAVEAVRERVVADLKGRTLRICSDANVYAYSYPEISFKDNIASVVSSARRAGEYSVQTDCYLNGLEEVVSDICTAEFIKLREPCAIFNGGEGQPFYYEEGSGGAVADGAKLRGDILSSLREREFGQEFKEVRLEVERSSPHTELQELKERTARLSAFTTYFDSENSSRVANIKLAGGKISGCVLSPEESFSFNARVGARTEKNGFKKAKIIEDGRFVYGVGGGVCQVSTTLYNAALLAGLKVTEFHPHSLAVSYVSPSRDAMVSGTYSDLKFVNTTNSPVYIRVLTGLYYVRCEVYGLSDGAEYSLSSVVTGEEDGVVSSECYLTVTRGGQSSKKLLRRDNYLPQKTFASQPGYTPANVGARHMMRCGV